MPFGRARFCVITTSRPASPNSLRTLASVIAFDMNAILHTQLRRTDEEHAQVLVCGCTRLRPRGEADRLAVDGRRRSPSRRSGSGGRGRRGAARRRREDPDRDERPRGISSLVATPGTKFMRRFEEALLFFVCSELSTYRARGLRFLVSGADVPGEGEIKLLGDAPV